MGQDRQNSNDRSTNRIDWLIEELDEGNLSHNQLELAAYLGDVDAKTLVDGKESTDDQKQDLRSWLYGLNMGGKAALVRICCLFARDCLNYWHSFVNGKMEWFEHLSKAVEVSERWVLKPSREHVKLAKQLQPKLDDILGQIDILCHEGDFPEEGLYITQVAHYTIGTTTWTVDEATADYIELGKLAEVEAIANTGPAYEMVEAVTIANKILKQKDDEIRSRIQDILLPWIFNPYGELTNDD